MVNIEALEIKIKKQNITDLQIANAIGIDLSTWYRRKLAPQKLQIGEIDAIKELLCLSKEEAVNIFLN